MNSTTGSASSDLWTGQENLRLWNGRGRFKPWYGTQRKKQFAPNDSWPLSRFDENGGELRDPRGDVNNQRLDGVSRIGGCWPNGGDPWRDGKAGPLPVIIYSPSFSSVAWESADLCEYLASFGYVVIAAPAMGEKTRESTHDLEGAEVQAEDISFLVGFAQTLPDTDMRRVAAVGFSWGGLADLLAAAHDDRIDALVSLDGSERYFPGFVKASGYAKPEQMRIPLIYFEEGDQSVEAQDAVTTKFHSEGPSVLNAWEHGDLLKVHMLGLFHPAFYSMSYRNQSVWQTEFRNDADREA